MSTTKQRLREQRKQRLAEQNKPSCNIRKLYIYMLKYKNYKAKCFRSKLSPGSFIVEFRQLWHDGDWYLRKRITIKPVKERNVRF